MAFARRVVVVAVLLFQMLEGAQAQEVCADTLHLKVYFKSGHSEYDSSYKENWSRSTAFRKAIGRYLTDSAAHYTVTVVDIRTGASPDGNTNDNQELSEQRCNALYNYVASFVPEAGRETYRFNPVGEDWENLAQSIRRLQLPWAPRAVEIIENTPVWVRNSKGKVVDSRKNRLRMLDGGDAWRYLKENVFDEVCSVGYVTVVLEHERWELLEGDLNSDTSEDATVQDGIQSATMVRGNANRLADYLGWATMDTLSNAVLEIQFRLDKTDIDPGFAGNRERFDVFVKDFLRIYSDVNPDAIQVDIYAGASPEGPADHNRELGEGRCEAIRSLIESSLGLKPSNIITHNLAARWDDFYAAVAASNEPWRDEVLAIIRLKPSADGSKRDHRENKLRALDKGTVWPNLLKGYLSPLRSGGSAVVSFHPERDTLNGAPASVQRFIQAPSTPVRDTVFLIADKELARRNCVAIPLRRSPSAGCPTRIALSPEYLSTLSQMMRDTLEIRFRLDSTRIDAGFAGNRYRIDRFIDAFNRRYKGLDPSVMRLDIYAGASPEGTADHNMWLGRERGASIRRLIRDSLGIRVNNIEVHNLAARWDDFYDAVAASDEPWKEEVLDIIRREPSRDTKSRDHREQLLRQLRGGSIWPVLLDRYLSPLRSGGSAVLSLRTDITPAMLQRIAGGSSSPCGDTGWQYEGDTLWICGGSLAPAAKDTVVVMQNTPYGMYPYDQYPWQNLPEGYYFDENGRLRQRKVKKALVPADKTPAWAVKTNLLFWGVVAPNVSVEVPLGWRNRWSLEWEYDHPWFIWSHNSHASQILNMSLELRYYFGNRDFHRWLDGFHMGLAFGGGKYDWEWTVHEGWQGEFINPYLNIGYQHRWGKHWAVDAGLGIGVIPSRYRHYYGGSVYPDNHLEPWDIHLIWHDTGHFVYPGLTHVNVSISYMFNNWPFLMHNMSSKRRQEWAETYNSRVEHERETRYQKEVRMERKANERDDAKVARKEARKAARATSRKSKKANSR
ncbi:MAG: DUF3575 domain-containing protein [Bacteroidales bacterium]|nr:DUF3575 domain-containing protein [Bacteroidales bacterium]